MKPKLILSLLLLGLLIYPTNYATSEPTRDNLLIQTYRITNTPKGEKTPSIWEDIIIWDDGNIMAYDFNNNSSWTVSDGGIWPKINSNKIVWAENRNKSSITDLDIYLFSIGTMTITRITNDTQTQNIPDVWEDRIIYANGSNNGDIYLYNLSTGEERAVCTNNASQTNPDIWGDYVVWEDWRNGEGEIYLYNIITEKEERIGASANSDAYPHIWGNHVVWHETDGTVVLYNIETKEKLDLFQGGYPLIYDDYVVTIRTHHGTVLYVISEDKTYELGDDIDIIHGDIWENRIVYTKSGDVWMLEFTFPGEEEPEPGPGFRDRYGIPIAAAGILIAAVAVVGYWVKKRK